jgi:hypothetical protein
MKDNIPGFMGYYVSKTGSVYSRYVRGSRGKLSNEFTPLIPKKRPKYYSVSLYRDGKSTKIFVHRLVATVYVPNPNNLPVVKAYYNTLLSELIQLGFTKWKVNKTLLRVLGKRFGVGDRVIRNILNNSYENKESRGSKR